MFPERASLDQRAGKQARFKPYDAIELLAINGHVVAVEIFHVKQTVMKAVRAFNAISLLTAISLRVSHFDEALLSNVRQFRNINIMPIGTDFYVRHGLAGEEITNL